MNDPISLRKLFRETLAVYPNRRILESLIFKSLSELSMDLLKVSEFSEARNRNRSQGYVESRANADHDEAEWFLTDAGKQKEGL